MITAVIQAGGKGTRLSMITAVMQVGGEGT